MNGKYDIYKLTDMDDHATIVLEIREPMTESEIDEVCVRYGVDSVVYAEGVSVV